MSADKTVEIRLHRWAAWTIAGGIAVILVACWVMSPVPADFDAPLPPETLAEFEGR